MMPSFSITKNSLLLERERELEFDRVVSPFQVTVVHLLRFIFRGLKAVVFLFH
jgi:hypothetical protein